MFFEEFTKIVDVGDAYHRGYFSDGEATDMQ